MPLPLHRTGQIGTPSKGTPHICPLWEDNQCAKTYVGGFYPCRSVGCKGEGLFLCSVLVQNYVIILICTFHYH